MKDHAPLSDHFCCLGRVLYGIRRYSTRCVWHGTITHVGTVQQSRDVTKSERYKNRDGTWFQLVPYRPVFGLTLSETDVRRSVQLLMHKVFYVGVRCKQKIVGGALCNSVTPTLQSQSPNLPLPPTSLVCLPPNFNRPGLWRLMHLNWSNPWAVVFLKWEYFVHICKSCRNPRMLEQNSRKTWYLQTILVIWIRGRPKSLQILS